MSKTANVVQIHTADAAFKRVKPLLDQLRDNIQAAAQACGDEYNALPDSEKAAFAEKISKTYGWSQRRLQDFAKIQKQLPKKQRIISTLTSAPKQDFSTGVADELIKVDDKLLEKAARRGMFDREVSVRDIRKLRQTGQIPSPKKAAPKTDLDKIKKLMVDADYHMRMASLKIGDITAIMEDTGIRDAKGREATALVKSFEKLCTKMATANPATSKRAFQILRGEV